jgi:5'(3')-deoxyribonucleotidase
LFDAPHNVNVTGYPRVRNWKEVEQYFASRSARPTVQALAKK